MPWWEWATAIDVDDRERALASHCQMLWHGLAALIEVGECKRVPASLRQIRQAGVNGRVLPILLGLWYWKPQLVLAAVIYVVMVDGTVEEWLSWFQCHIFAWRCPPLLLMQRFLLVSGRMVWVNWPFHGGTDGADVRAQSRGWCNNVNWKTVSVYRAAMACWQ